MRKEGPSVVPEYIRHLRALVGGDELLQIPSVSIALRDSDGRVLLARHTEGGVWLLSGGTIEPAEVPSDAAVREMFEETGLIVRLTGIVGVFGGPEFIVHYRNGHRTSYVMTVFEGEFRAGNLQADSTEVLELRFVSEGDARGLEKAAWVSEVLQAVFHGSRTSGFRPETWTPTVSG
jgi:8-oxo-dGTP pyrophosphatase MutT (NUDIX family)